MSEDTGTLVVIQPDEAFDVFTKPGATDPIIAQLRAFAAEAPTDVSTLKGRKAITTFATKFVKSKTFLESFGKEIADDVKEIPKKVDAARKLLRDTCDELRDAVRKPLDEWEAAEEARVAKHRDTIWTLVAATMWARNGRSCDLDEIDRLLSVVMAIDPAKADEFKDEVEREKVTAVDTLASAHQARTQYDAEQAELIELRRLKAEREEADRKAAEGRAEAERQKEAEREAAERAAAAAEIAVQQERARAEAAAQAERDAAAQREAELERQAFEAKRLQERAEQEARDTAARIEREQQEANAREEDERRGREANKAHARKINRQALDDLMTKAGLGENDAVKVVTLIATSQIRNISIKY